MGGISLFAVKNVLIRAPEKGKKPIFHAGEPGSDGRLTLTISRVEVVNNADARARRRVTVDVTVNETYTLRVSSDVARSRKRYRKNPDIGTPLSAGKTYLAKYTQFNPFYGPLLILKVIP